MKHLALLLFVYLNWAFQPIQAYWGQDQSQYQHQQQYQGGYYGGYNGPYQNQDQYQQQYQGQGQYGRSVDPSCGPCQAQLQNQAQFQNQAQLQNQVQPQGQYNPFFVYPPGGDYRPSYPPFYLPQWNPYGPQVPQPAEYDRESGGYGPYQGQSQKEAQYQDDGQDGNEPKKPKTKRQRKPKRHQRKPKKDKEVEKQKIGLLSRLADRLI